MSSLFQAFLQDPTIGLDQGLLSRSPRRHISKDIVQKTGPANLAVSLDETKLHIRADDYDDDDDLITTLIKGCTEWAEKLIWGTFITQTWTQTQDSVPRGSRVDIRMPPIQSIVKVSSFDRDNVETTFANTNFFLNDRGRRESQIVLNDGAVWPTDTRDTAGFKIEFKAGYGDNETDIPDSIQLALKQLVAVKYENREEEEDFRFKQAMGILNQFMTPIYKAGRLVICFVGSTVQVIDRLVGFVWPESPSPTPNIHGPNPRIWNSPAAGIVSSSSY